MHGNNHCKQGPSMDTRSRKSVWKFKDKQDITRVSNTSLKIFTNRNGKKSNYSGETEQIPPEQVFKVNITNNGTFTSCPPLFPNMTQ